MTVQAEILPPESQDIIEAVAQDPTLAILDQAKATAFLEKVREFTGTIGEVDMAKAKDRDAVRTMSARVTKAKTGINRARLGMTEELRTKVAEINAAGKAVIEGLEQIADEVRAPLTAWETAEKEREALVEATIAKIKVAALVTISDTSASVAARGNEIFETEIDPKVFLKRTDEAEEAKTATMKALHEAMHFIREREEAKAELDAMKAAEAARLAKEAEEQAERDRKAREEQAAREAKEREERLQQEAADRARKEAEDAAEQQRLATEREAQRKIDEANRRAEQAEQEKQAELDRIAAEQAAAQRKADEEAAEQERRERSRKHRQTVMGKIKADIIEHGAVTEAEAAAIVKAMVAGKVAHVTVQF
ncbi:MAG: hypothetical protein ACOVQ0_16435 [Novosphingobium sp.]|uniref:hypothetical protein n=1 Tax=Novosphingobium sp. TaxID=1874826 RepID=UPI003B9D53B5